LTKERIIYFTEGSQNSGFGQCGRNISKGLAKAGFDTYLLAWGYQMDEILNYDGYKILPFGPHPPADHSPFTLANIYQQL